jgi:hypothetical protein
VPTITRTRPPNSIEISIRLRYCQEWDVKRKIRKITTAKILDKRIRWFSGCVKICLIDSKLNMGQLLKAIRKIPKTLGGQCLIPMRDPVFPPLVCSIQKNPVGVKGIGWAKPTLSLFEHPKFINPG